jgi:hypothetical protein
MQAPFSFLALDTPTTVLRCDALLPSVEGHVLYAPHPQGILPMPRQLGMEKIPLPSKAEGGREQHSN